MKWVFSCYVKCHSYRWNNNTIWTILDCCFDLIEKKKDFHLCKLSRRNLVSVAQPTILQLFVGLVDLSLLLAQNVSCWNKTIVDLTLVLLYAAVHQLGTTNAKFVRELLEPEMFTVYFAQEHKYQAHKRNQKTHL